MRSLCGELVTDEEDCATGEEFLPGGVVGVDPSGRGQSSGARSGSIGASRVCGWPLLSRGRESEL